MNKSSDPTPEQISRMLRDLAYKQRRVISNTGMSGAIIGLGQLATVIVLNNIIATLIVTILSDLLLYWTIRKNNDAVGEITMLFMAAGILLSGDVIEKNKENLTNEKEQ